MEFPHKERTPHGILYLHGQQFATPVSTRRRRKRPGRGLARYAWNVSAIGPATNPGLGKWFLQWTIDKAWSYQPKRFWLHTCTLDHPAALPNYLKAGFAQFKKEPMRRELCDF